MAQRDLTKLFEDLETQNLVELEETKKVFFDLVTSTKESWVAHGLMDYFNQTGSVRIVDVLLKTNPVHIFDRLLEWMRTGSMKLPALSLLGHIISKHPTWLFNIEKHPVFRETFRILKTERDVIPEMSALLCIITLLAKIPFLMRNNLDDLFEAFSHLAAWNNHRTSVSSGFKVAPAELLEHLQIGLYIYFQRLYGMFPTNFVDYLKREYTSNTNANHLKRAIFTHTIVPLLETVRMHPKLITETLESEKSEHHWRKVTPHDVITQCSKLSVDSCDNHQSQTHHHDQSCGTGGSSGFQRHILEITHINRYELTSTSGSVTTDGPVPSAVVENFWTPSQMPFTSPIPSSLQQSAPSSVTAVSMIQSSPANIQKPHGLVQPFVGSLGGTSPPEAAVEATPETTPMNDLLRTQKSYPPQNSSTVRAIALGGSQPSSPLKKSTFRYPGEDIGALTKILKLQAESNHTEQLNLPPSIPSSPLPIQQQQQMAVPSSTGVGGLPKGRGGEEKPDHHLTMQKIDPESKFELSQSPCNVGGLHMPNSRSIQEFKEISTQRERSLKSDSSPEEANRDEAGKKTISAQTESLWNSSTAYEHMLVELSQESKKDGESCEIKKPPVAPKEILDKIIEAAIAKKNAQNGKNWEEYYKNHIMLLSYQLNFERHQREMTAERNRRLFGRDKDYKILELNKTKLEDQVEQLLGEVDSLKSQLDKLHAKFSVDKSELVAELTNWKQKFQGDQDELKLLRGTLEQCEIRLETEERQNREQAYEMKRMKGELFDLRNERTELIHQAAMSTARGEQLINLQSELLLMGELHQQWQNKLCDVEREQQRERSMDILQIAYEQELEDLHSSLQQKTSKLDTVSSRLKDSDKKLADADVSLLEQKRILKVTKEENEEKFKALERKYETQKAIIMKMEEHLLELYRNPASCPPAELLRSEMVSSAEHASPSISPFSSSPMSTSLRSATEVKVGPTPSNSGNMIAASISSHTLKAANSTENKSNSSGGV